MGIDALGGSSPGVETDGPFSESAGDFKFLERVTPDELSRLIAESDAYLKEFKEFRNIPGRENWTEEQQREAIKTMALYLQNNQSIDDFVYGVEDDQLWEVEWDLENVEDKYREAAGRLGIEPPDVYYFSHDDMNKFADSHESNESVKDMDGFFMPSHGTGGRRGTIIVIGEGDTPSRSSRKLRIPFHELGHAGQHDKYPYSFPTGNNPYKLPLHQHGTEFLTDYRKVLSGIVDDSYLTRTLDHMDDVVKKLAKLTHI